MTPPSISLTAPAPPRSPWQLFYGAAHRLRRAWYRRRAQRLPVPVISVGNLHWGGGGKTPLTAALCAGLRDRGLAVCILSRGYGRSERGVQVVSAGEGPMVGPSRAGDEPVLLAGDLPGVSVVVGAERHRAGLHALAQLEPRPQVFVLDDGFSHLALERDLDLLAFPAADPFAGGRLAPGGRLREPLASASRAHAVVLTGAPAGGEDDLGRELATALAPHGFRGPGFASPTAALPARRIDGLPIPAGSRVVLVAGIARPQRFFADAAAQGYEVVETLAYPDHHTYPDSTLAELRTAAAAADLVLTTAKDRVKLHGRLDAPLAELPIRAEPEAAFWQWLDGELRRLTADSG